MGTVPNARGVRAGAAAVTTFHAEPGLRVSFWRNVGIVEVRGEADVRCMRVMEQGYRVLMSQYPAGIAVLAIVRSGTPVANDVARAECVRFIKDLGPQLLVIATVIEDTGVMGSVLRSVVRGLNLVAGNGNLMAFAGVSYAADAIVRRLFPGEDAVRTRWELVQAVLQSTDDEGVVDAGGPPSAPASGIRPLFRRTRTIG